MAQNVNMLIQQVEIENSKLRREVNEQAKKINDLQRENVLLKNGQLQILRECQKTINNLQREKKESLKDESVKFIKTHMAPNDIQRLETENDRLRERCGSLEKDLKEKQTLLSNVCLELDTLKAINRSLSQRNQYLRRELHVTTLLAKIKLLERRVCNHDCVLGVIADICKNMCTRKGIKFCCRQLEKIMILSPGPTIEGEDLKCAHLMKILEGRNIVKKHAEYKFDRYNEIFEAWKELMTMNADSGIVIIGIVKSGTNSVGHVELCYLDTRTPDKNRIKIHDPQREMSEKGIEVDLQGFTKHVTGDEGVIFYTVTWDELQNIITNHQDSLHLEMSDTNFGTVAIEEVE